MTDFIKRFLINLAVIIGVIIILFILSPTIMGQVFQVYGLIFSPIIIILLLVVAALPRRSTRR